MENDSEFLKEQMNKYREELEPLTRYLPWFEKASPASAATIYKGDGLDTPGSMNFPVYDSTLLSFIKVASASPLMDRNYQYVYTRKGIKNPSDERKHIETADYKDWGTLCGILSKYVLGGRTRAVLWTQGVSERIFYLCISKMLEIVTEWNSERNINR